MLVFVFVFVFLVELVLMVTHSDIHAHPRVQTTLPVSDSRG